MKKIIALLSAASLLTLSSCDLAMLGEGTMGRRDTQRIERGMSQEQVYSLMGRPTYRRFGDNGIEEWEYHKSGLFEKRMFKKFETIRSSSSMSLMCCFSLSCGNAVSFSSSKSSSNVCIFKSSIAFCSSCIY